MMSIHIAGTATDLLDAIDQLRPEFAVAEQMRPILRDAAKLDTYFATIPKDILDIIITMIGNTRRRINAEAIERCAQSWQEFFKKYAIAPHACILNLPLLKHDYPDEFRNINNNEVVHIKEIHGKLLVVCGTHLHHIRYIGARQYITIDRNQKTILHPSGTEFGICNQSKHIRTWYIPLYILPCGLVLISENTPRTRRELLYDPSSNLALILPTITPDMYDKLVDDFAEDVLIKDNCTPACTWNELKCWFVTCLVQDPSVDAHHFFAKNNI